MKTYNLLFLTLLLTTCTKTNKSSSESIADFNSKSVSIVPTMSSEILDRNTVHCSNIEYLWNELKENSDKGFKKTVLLNELNESQTWQNSINRNEMILSFGDPNSVYNDILRQYKSVYGVDNPNIQKQGTTFWGFTYKAIKFKYQDPFDKHDLTFLGKEVNGFGLHSGNWSIYRKVHFKNQYEILYFNYDGEFAVQLKPNNTKDEIILVMLEKRKNFKEMYEYAESLISKGKIEKRLDMSHYFLGESDELLIPIIKFKKTRNYSELSGIEFSSKFGPIETFEQSINFDFNERGVVMEAEVMGFDSVATPAKPKLLHFNKPFYLFIRQAGSSYPYFNLWVADPEILDKKKKSKK